MKNQTAKILLLLMMFLILSPLASMAAGSVQVISKTGGIFAGDPYYNSAKNAYTVDFVGQDVAVIKLQSWSAGFGEMLRERTVSAAADGFEYMIGNNFTCNTSYKAFYYNAGNVQIGSLQIVVGGLVDPTCDSGGAGETPPESGTCDMCELFKCPGWADYMAKLDGIAGKIPAAPNWGQVADTFRDSIAPQIKKDLADVIGRTETPTTPNYPGAPSKPSAPSKPGAPSQPGGLTGGLDAPTGQEAPGLDGFNSGDLKDAAPDIKQNEDPSGGFNIIDPIGSMPSQEDFIKNADGTEPVEKGQDPVEPKWQMPPDFTEPKYEMPTYDEPTFTEPKINDPNINYNNAPAPDGGTASPDYKEPTYTAPRIDYESMPTPSASGSSPEIQSQYDRAPTPNQGGESAPLPGG